MMMMMMMMIKILSPNRGIALSLLRMLGYVLITVSRLYRIVHIFNDAYCVIRGNFWVFGKYRRHTKYVLPLANKKVESNFDSTA